jgi:dTDP-4-amino-4,6-dideoxy-D-galactose acyltransferase
VPIARVAGDVLTAQESAALDEWAAEHAVRCLFFLSRSDDPATIAVAQASGFDLVDVRMELSREPATGELPPSIRPFAESDVPELGAIARTSHDNTRFFADSHFPRARCEDLYETWIEESCKGWAGAVFVAEREAAVCGYVTCHAGEDGRAFIGLIAVASDRREGGAGTDLVSAAVRWSADRGCVELAVVTQGSNVRAQRLFQRCGFRTSSVGLWLHKWYER